MKNIANYNFSAHKCDFKKRKSFLKAVCQTEACQQDFFFSHMINCNVTISNECSTTKFSIS